MLGARDNSWRAITASVRGASHLRTGAPNQDSVGVSPATREGPPLILAVSMIVSVNIAPGGVAGTIRDFFEGRNMKASTREAAISDT